MALTDTFQSFLFLSTPSARRATLMLLMASATIAISIHALREEGDVWSTTRSSTPPNFYPRPPRGGRPGHKLESIPYDEISIHALREEGDYLITYAGKSLGEFLSTPSARRATCRTSSSAWATPYFYPRPPRGGRLKAAGQIAKLMQFLSTPSARRATPTCAVNGCILYISIHALREEGDGDSRGQNPGYFYFYPRPPRGGRPAKEHTIQKRPIFLSTPSARRATLTSASLHCACPIFLSTPSARRATLPGGRRGRRAKAISIHALREEGDATSMQMPCSSTPFLSTPSARRATKNL